jgi:hypothetical protein
MYSGSIILEVKIALSRKFAGMKFRGLAIPGVTELTPYKAFSCNGP